MELQAWFDKTRFALPAPKPLVDLAKIRGMARGALQASRVPFWMSDDGPFVHAELVKGHPVMLLSVPVAGHGNRGGHWFFLPLSAHSINGVDYLKCVVGPMEAFLREGDKSVLDVPRGPLDPKKSDELMFHYTVFPRVRARRRSPALPGCARLSRAQRAVQCPRRARPAPYRGSGQNAERLHQGVPGDRQPVWSSCVRPVASVCGRGTGLVARRQHPSAAKRRGAERISCREGICDLQNPRILADAGNPRNLRLLARRGRTHHCHVPPELPDHVPRQERFHGVLSRRTRTRGPAAAADPIECEWHQKQRPRTQR